MINTSSKQNLTPEQIEHMAIRRVKAKMGWYLHVAIYVVVNLFLIAGAMFQGKHWHFFPIIGWGFGLAIHGVIVWFKCSSAGFAWRERMLVRERAALNNQGL
jgi:hypothetical protein